jgi:hypothetical protein
MAANMARNLYHALLRLPVKSIIIWMDSMVALYWLSNPGKPWKTFVTNRVKKIAEITNEITRNYHQVRTWRIYAAGELQLRKW